MSPFNKHILSFPDIEIVKLEVEWDVEKSVIKYIPWLNQIISSFSDYEKGFFTPISNLNLVFNPQ
jgi:hypothetical protein